MAERMKIIRRGVIAASLALGGGSATLHTERYAQIQTPSELAPIVRTLSDASGDLVPNITKPHSISGLEYTFALPKPVQSDKAEEALKKARTMMASEGLGTDKIDGEIAVLPTEPATSTYSQDLGVIDDVATQVTARAHNQGRKQFKEGLPAAISAFLGVGGTYAAYDLIRTKEDKRRRAMRRLFWG